MAGQNEESPQIVRGIKDEIDNVTKCSRCLETVQKVTMLPCGHSLCPKCLQSYGKDKSPEDDVECPLCRKTFKQSSGRFRELPANYSNSDTSSDVDLKSDSLKDLCNVCLKVEHRNAAVGCCVECDENLCRDCFDKHGVLKHYESHRTMTLNPKLTAAQLVKDDIIYCTEHRHHRADLYCFDCKKMIVYSVTEHKEHEFTDFKKSCTDIINEIGACSENIKRCMRDAEDSLKQAKISESEHKANVREIKEAVEKRYKALKSTLDSQRLQIIDALNEMESRTKEDLETNQQEAEGSLIEMKKFEKYWHEFKSKGTTSDIVRSASDLLERAEGLLKLNSRLNEDRNLNSRLNYCKIEYLPSHFEEQQLIGALGSIKEMQHNTEASPPLDLHTKL